MVTMRYLAAVVAVVTGLLAVEACAQNRGTLALPSEALLNQGGLTRAWWGHSTSNASRDKVRFLTLDTQNHLFVQSSNAVITCFDAESGRKLWATRVGNPDADILQCSYSDDLLFAIHGKSCFGIRKHVGDIVWELELPSTASVSPATDGKYLYIGMVDGSMYAFDYAKIAKLSEQGLMPRWSYTTTVWRYATKGSISTPAVPSGRLVAFASSSGSLYSVTSEDRRLVYQFETDAKLAAPVVRYRDWLILSGQDYNVYALSIDNGRIGWQFPAGSDIRKAPVVVRDDLFVMPERGGTYKLQGDTGKPLWWNPRGRDFVAVSPDRVYLRGLASSLMIVANETGADLATLPLEAFSLNVRNDINDRIYMASPSGLIVCLRQLDLEVPAFHGDLDNKPIVPIIAPEDVGTRPAPTDPAAPAAEPAMPDDPNAPATEVKPET